MRVPFFTERERARLVALARRLHMPVPPHLTVGAPVDEHEELVFLRELVIRILED